MPNESLMTNRCLIPRTATRKLERDGYARLSAAVAYLFRSM
jgi:hypothetical protein